jgi:ATP-dependent DNA helicase RecQ
MVESNRMDSYEGARSVLQRYWGYDDFRPGQWDVISPALAGEDVLAILPTGGGKSICYQVPALVLGGLTVVVSPLIALMEDQVEGLARRGIPATYLNSTLSYAEIEQRLINAEFGKYRLLYLAPERLKTEIFVARAARLGVRLLAVDEAHCVSEWGRQFRPSYLEIADARALMGNPPMIAVTATATPEVRRDVEEKLGLRSPRVLVHGFDRPNITWSIFRDVNKRTKVKDVLTGVRGSGIIYAATRRGTEAWAAWLREEGESALAYHGGMAASERTSTQVAWIDGAVRVIVATSAFGMGIDKPDVRFVLHVEVPAGIEGYYQEAGRGGRDGRMSHAVLLFDEEDVGIQRQLIENGHPETKHVQQVYDALCNVHSIAVGAESEEPLKVDMEKLARMTGMPPGRITASVDMLIEQGVLEEFAVSGNLVRIRFDCEPEVIRGFIRGEGAGSLRAFAEKLLRTVPADAFAGWTEVRLRSLERATGMKIPGVLRALEQLAGRGFISFVESTANRLVRLREARARKIQPVDTRVRRSKKRSMQQLSDMLRYARSVGCRRRFLLNYFGERASDSCGKCDICLGRHEAVVVMPEDEPTLRRILGSLLAGESQNTWFRESASPAPYKKDGLVAWLVQEDYVRYRDSFGTELEITDKGISYLEAWTPRAQ